jgi:hypothetical protein
MALGYRKNADHRGKGRNWGQCLERFNTLSQLSGRVLRKGDPPLALSHFFEMCFAKKLRDVLMGLSPIPSEQEIDLTVRLGVKAFLEGHAPKPSAALAKKKGAK